MASHSRIPCVLSIAGSDSGGGAGIQADIKAFARCGVHGTCAVTAITAQSTLGVLSVHHVPPASILDQVRAVQEDIGIDAVKVGMLGTAETARAVASALRGLAPGTPVVIDPVMVAESGAVLLDPDARGVLVDELLPLATVTTPNIPEARALVGRDPAEDVADGDPAGDVADGDPAEDVADGDPADDVAPADLARAVRGLGPRCVVVTGGHDERSGPEAASVIDVFFDGDEIVEIAGERHPDGAAHGSGCTHSSALAAHLALGSGPLEAARQARAIAADAVRSGLRDLGGGPGPVDALAPLTRPPGADRLS